VENKEGTYFIMNKLKIAILFGGASSEHDVSCVSAKSIASNIDKDKYDIVMLGITKCGEWFLFDDDIELLPNDKWLDSDSLKKAYISPDSSIGGIVCENGDIIKLDAVFPVLHGKNGEDGTVQGLLQLAKIPFVGCDATSSGSCMDKAVTNAVADAFGIAQAKWCSFTKYEYEKNTEKCINSAIEKLGLPIFVKPANAGSSVGISKARNIEELKAGIELALKEDKKVVLEEFVDGFEVECAVLGNDEPIAAEVGQIIAAAEFYDFDSKYNNPASELHIPALISKEKRDEVRASALGAYKALGCEGMSRCDFFVTKGDERVLLNEINTIPGQTPISMYPKLFEAVGVSYSSLIDKLINLALERGGNI
jgi:D-alanine-D-alanine ligase